MSRFRPFGVTPAISTPGTICLSLFQLVLSDFPCEENEMCEHYHGQNSNSWYIWFLLLIFLVVLLCGIMLFCFQCWLKRRQIDCSRRTVAVFVVGDLDPMDGTEAAVSPTVGSHHQTEELELYPVPWFNTFGPPPPYEETKSKPILNLNHE